MRTRTLTRAFAVAAALVVVAGTAAGAVGPAATLSATAADGGAETRTAVAGSAEPPAARPPTGVRPAGAIQCMDRVVYTVDASAIAPQLPTVCIAVGGVLRIASLGPGA